MLSSLPILLPKSLNILLILLILQILLNLVYFLDIVSVIILYVLLGIVGFVLGDPDYLRMQERRVGAARRAPDVVYRRGVRRQLILVNYSRLDERLHVWTASGELSDPLRFLGLEITWTAEVGIEAGHCSWGRAARTGPKTEKRRVLDELIALLLK